MVTFNVTSYENGRIIKTVKAIDYTTAFNDCLNNNINVYDDYFLETTTETNTFNKLPSRTIYIDEER